jgi:hypothetical protein
VISFRFPRHLTLIAINIGNAGSAGSCPVHNPQYDFKTLHCPSEQVSSRDWSRKSCHNQTEGGTMHKIAKLPVAAVMSLAVFAAE